MTKTGRGCGRISGIECRRISGTGLLGLVWSLSAMGIAPAQEQIAKEVVLYSFTGGADGGDPSAGVIRDSAGNLYGTTQHGGAGYGVVFKLDAATHHLRVLYTFTGGPDGAYPMAGVIRDSAGNLYGTTACGGTGPTTQLCANAGGAGAAGAGVVFRVDPAGQETVLHNFLSANANDGYYPVAGVIGDSAGNLYGTTEYGGIWNAGIVFKLDTAGHETVLHTFTEAADDGGLPFAGVIRDAKGNLYGTTLGGGIAGMGVVFELAETGGPAGVLHSFKGADGGLPEAGVIRDAKGNLYGTTFGGGGPAGWGNVYKLDATHHLKVLYTFTGGADGGYPHGGVIRDSAGNLYGTTSNGGIGGNGIMFKVDTAGQETVLYSFCSLADCADGGTPYAGVIRDAKGNLYGTTFGGGEASRGVVFKIKL